MSRPRLFAKVERWRAMTGGDRWTLLGVMALLPAIGTALRCVGIKRTCRLLGWAGRGARARTVAPEIAQAEAANLARLVAVASRHGPYGATCLRQSLALWWLLRGKGIAAELKIGVGKGDAGVDAHAWVELDGRVINDRAMIGDNYAAYAGLDRRLLQASDRRAASAKPG